MDILLTEVLDVPFVDREFPLLLCHWLGLSEPHLPELLVKLLLPEPHPELILLILDVGHDVITVIAFVHLENWMAMLEAFGR